VHVVRQLDDRSRQAAGHDADRSVDVDVDADHHGGTDHHPAPAHDCGPGGLLGVHRPAVVISISGTPVDQFCDLTARYAGTWGA
jgi:hypothetical protein